MEIDPATRRNLELAETLAGKREGSLLAVIDRTVTGAGGRLLARRLAAPLTDPAEIARRLDAVAFFAAEEGLRAGMRRTLAARARHRAGAVAPVGGPRRAARPRRHPRRARRRRRAARTLWRRANRRPRRSPSAARDLGEHATLVDRLARALRPDLPILARDGGFIAEGYAPQLDELRTLRDESRRLIAGLQARYAKETGVASLKIRHNNMLGYYVEVSAANADKIPTTGDATFIHRQTMAGAVRYTTAELSRPGGAHRPRRRPGAGAGAAAVRGSGRRGGGARPSRSRWPPTRWRGSTSPRRSPSSPSSGAMSARWWTRRSPSR